MAAEVSADLTLIQDEDVLKRMWAETEDFSRKKEIRARMYKLREQRLKDFYTTGEVVTEITGRKHTSTTHTESIGDQGFLSMKSKEIRDSESPTRDFNRRNNNGYWTSVEERGYTSGNQDGSTIERSEESRKGEGLVIEGNTETRMALSAQNVQEKSSKSDENMSLKSEINSQSQGFASSSVTDTGDSCLRTDSKKTQKSSVHKEEKTSETSNSSTKITSSSSSRRIVTSSVSSNYQVTGEDTKSLRNTDVRAITSGSDSTTYSSDQGANDRVNIRTSNRLESDIYRDDSNNLQLQHQFNDKLSKESEDINISSARTIQDSKQHQSHQENQSFKTIHNYSTVHNYSTSNKEDNQRKDFDNDGKSTIDSRSIIRESVIKDSTKSDKQNVVSETKHTNLEDISRKNKTGIHKSEVNEFIINENSDSAVPKKTVPSNDIKTGTTSTDEPKDVQTSAREISNNNDSTTIQSHVHSNTNQKILNEIHKLDTYLLNQNIKPSEPVTPKTETDGAQWTVVSNRDGEFVYRNDKSHNENDHTVPLQPREPAIKHPSSLDLPKDATDGQYITTYQQSYNRISVDNSPSHEYFVRTLRASPDRLTPSPTKSSRGSLDRNSPDRKLRATSKGSLDRSSPETSKKRTFSKGSLDRSTPERSFRSSPSKTPDRERRGSCESYKIERKKDNRRKTTEITQQTLRDTSNKTKRKFSSTQQKAANKTRVSTPGVSPSTSPTRNVYKKDVTSGSESDISQATYNKTSSISSFHDENILSTKEEKRENLIDSTEDDLTYVTDKKLKPRERSPDFSSEGSVSREINKTLKSHSDIKNENNSFKPIKQVTTDETNKNFILEEQNTTISENVIVKTSTSDDKTNRRDSQVIVNDRDQISDDKEEQPKDFVDHECNLINNNELNRKVTGEQTQVIEHIKEGKSIKPTPSHLPKAAEKPNNEANYPNKSKVNPNKGSYSPERKSKDLSYRQPLRPLNEKRSLENSSTTTERKSKVSTSKNKNLNKEYKAKHSPSTSPERPRTTPTTLGKTQNKSHDENRRSISSSPERKGIPGTTEKSIRKNENISKTFISEEQKTEIRDRSQSMSREGITTKKANKISSNKPEKNTNTPSKSRGQGPSPSSSPERNISPERRVNLNQARKDTQKFSPQTTPSPASQRVPQKIVSKDSRITRHSSIPRANKLSPRNSKEKIEPSTNKPTTQFIRKPTPIPKLHQTTKVISSTRISNTITEQKQQTSRPTQIKMSNISHKPTLANVKKMPTKIATPKATTNKQKTTALSNNKPSIHKTTKTGSSPMVPANKLVPQEKNRKNTTKSSEITLLNESVTENNEFLNKERSVHDLEDENPPEEFYVEYDYKTDDTASPERRPKPSSTQECISTISVTKNIKTTRQQNKKNHQDNKNQPKSIKPKYEVPSESQPKNTTQKIKEIHSSVCKTSRKVKNEKKLSNEYSSSSSSSEEESDREELEHTVSENKKSDLNTHTSNQDLLSVVVQHPKSSRESSPGYQNTGQPFCTTSEDGESNPRYADYISEPDDVEIFDKNIGPTAPIRLTEDESVDVKSVADRVNVFLEATKSTQETTTQHEVLVSSPRSVLKAKTMFENIAKNQSLNSQSKPAEINPKSENYPSYHPSPDISQDEPTISHTLARNVKHTEQNKNQKNYDQQTISKTFIEEETTSHNLVEQIHTKDSEPSKESIMDHELPRTGRSPPRKETCDEETFEKEIYYEIDESNKIKMDRKEPITKPSHKGTNEKNSIKKQKSPSPQRQQPKANHKNTIDSAKPYERRHSATLGARRQLFESTSEQTDKEEEHLTSHMTDYTVVSRKDSKPEVTNKHPIINEKSPSPQRNVKKKEEPQAKKPFERKSSGHVDVSSKKDFFERKVIDISTSASPAKKKPTPQINKNNNQSRPKSEPQSTVSMQETYDISSTKSKINSDITKTETELEFTEVHKKVPHGEVPKQKLSNTQQFTKKETDQNNKPHKSVSENQKLIDDEKIIKKTPKSEDVQRKFSKPEEIVRKLSKPQETVYIPSKSDSPSKSKHTDGNKSQIHSETYTRSTISSSRRSHSPEKRVDDISKNPPKPEEIVRKTSSQIETIETGRRSSKFDGSEVKMPRTREGLDRTSKQANITDEIRISEAKTESYMRSTVSSSVRGHTPEKGLRENTPESNIDSSPQSPILSNEIRRQQPHEKELNEDSTIKRTSIRTETKQEGGKFGVTLRKTPSSGKMNIKPTIHRQNSKPREVVDIESIFDLELLEEMLLKAVGYDDRRRIRAQIRLVKKQIEEEKNTTVSSKVFKTSVQSSLPSVRDIKRQESPLKSQDHKYEETIHYSRITPERREPLHSSPRSSPERHVKARSPEKHLPERSSTRRNSSEKVLTNGYKESKIVTETATLVRNHSVRKSEADIKETCPTDLITSSYGVGPTDENGRPLFGLKALRRTSTSKTLIDDTVEHETITEVKEESSLFGLKALQTEKMPAESGQLKELVERHQQYVKESSSKESPPVQKPKAKLRDSFILTQEEELASSLSGADDIPKGLSLKSIIQKHESNAGSNLNTSVESRSTIIKSHSTITSDGKVSLHRDVIHGEVSSKNNEEPVGKITKSSYSYQSPKDKESVPSVKSSTSTSLIGSRRSSGPKIEEITSSTSTSETNRRYSKEYTVEEVDSVFSRRRSSGYTVEGNVNKSILKNSNESGRRSSGPRITDVSDVGNEMEERIASVTKNISRVSSDTPETTAGHTVHKKSSKEENKADTHKKVITRGDSVKALQHKFQQATEAANQPSSRPYPRAGLILRSNTLQQIDDQTQMSSSMKHSSVERTTSKGKLETKSLDDPKSSVLKGQVVTHEGSELVQNSQVSKTDEPTSFLDNRSKVTGVQDILTRMRNADLVTEKTDSTEDAEARALLNKFLGASVILQGMEQGMRASQKQTDGDGAPNSPSSAALVIQAEKQRVKATTGRTTEDDIDEINDEKQLRILLESCSDYEGRRKLRARLRTIMAEQKGGTEDVEESHECSESSEVVRKGDVKTEAHSRTTSTSVRLTKANSVQSPFAKFKQLERQNSAPSTGRLPPLFTFTEPKLAQSASTIKERLLSWVQAQTRHYKNIQIDNFSTSWSNGLAFCALIHHFCPHAFDYDSLTPEKRRYNFELAFRVAEEEADIFPLLDVEDMVVIRKPDWKCVFTYVQSIYRRFHDSPDALPVF